MTQEKKIKICEIFGPTIQGEGSVIGRQTIFVRTFGCDSRCQLCDSMHSVDPKFPGANWTSMTNIEIVDEIEKLDPNGKTSITFSGGNPLIHDLTELIYLLKSSHREIWVETQGTIYKDWLPLCDVVTVSPKGPGMKDDVNGILSMKELEDFLGSCHSKSVNFKVVVFGEGDLDYAEEIMDNFPKIPMYLSMGNTAPPPHDNYAIGVLRDSVLDRMKFLIDLILRRKDTPLKEAIILPQLHFLIWGNQKGV
jgi:7-carboxy-7-deazaguanine synthase